MAKTDRQTDKTSRWAFTAYEEQWPIVDDFNKSALVAEFGYQHELCPRTNRKHRQGFLRTKQQVRFSAMTKAFPGIHFEVAKNWDALIQYCKKEETRDKSRPDFFSGTGSKEKPLTMAQALMKLASFADPVIVYDTVPVVNPLTGTTEHQQLWESRTYDHKAMYLTAVRNWIKINPDIIALVTQPQYKSAYYDFWKEFQQMAIESFEFDAPCSDHSITGGADDEIVEPPYEDFSEYAFAE